MRLRSYTTLPYFATEREHWLGVNAELRVAEAQTDALLETLEAHDEAGAVALQAGPVAQSYARADAALGDLIALDADEGTRLGREIASARRRAQHVSRVLDAVAVVLACALGAMAIVATRQKMGAVNERHQADERLATRLRSVAGAAVTISKRFGQTGSVREPLQTAVEQARAVVGADMAALGVGCDPSRPFEPFVFAGMDPGLLDAVGAPRPRGILGVPLAEKHTVRIDDVARDRPVGTQPEQHPPVGAFLAVALYRDDEPTGLLYLGRAPGAAPFTDEDAGAVELLAEYVANAMQNVDLCTSLHAEVGAREELLSVVSHDLRAPLSAMSISATLAQRKAAPDAPDRPQLEAISRNAVRMDRLIGDLLTAAKVRQGKLPIETKPEDPAALARDVVETCAAGAAAKRIRLTCETADDLPPVLCDAGRVAQCLTNLVGNALKFTPEGGSILVRVEGGVAGHRDVSFAVRDTGCGIPEEDLPHVFERYWQRGKDPPRGTGLGLYITKGIVEAHGGRISATSRVGEGSEFCFTLPAVEIAAPVLHA